jgi:EAL domain-containing protein (putative c-di-GMP-specific phosphodiesterase class I)
MGYLTSMDVDTLKLDRSFISEIEKSPDSLAIVTAINQMAGVLGMNVVAEGVEKESERKVLEDIDCNIGQGFLWSKALPANLLIDYLETRRFA